jgi:hypothetical protein
MPLAGRAGVGYKCGAGMPPGKETHMKFTRYLPIVALGAFAADCGTDTGDDTSDTGDGDFCFDCALLIMIVDATCDDKGNGSSMSVPRENPDDTITFDMEMGAWAGQVEIDIVETSVADGWTEFHIVPESANLGFPEGEVPAYECRGTVTTEPTEQAMPAGATSLEGYCDGWSFEINEVASANDVTDGATILNCNWWENGSNGFLKDIAVKVTVFAEDATTASDCIIFGHESATEFAADNCICFSGDNSCGDNNP